MTSQPPLSSIVKSRRLSFFGHLVRMDENADDSQVISERPPESWRRPPGWPRTTWMKTIQGDLSYLHLELPEARELAQNRPLWRDWCLCIVLHTRSGACCCWIRSVNVFGGVWTYYAECGIAVCEHVWYWFLFLMVVRSVRLPCQKRNPDPMHLR